MKQKKFTAKTVGIFIACLFMLSAATVSAQAAGTTHVNALDYKGVTYGTLTLSGNLSSAKKSFNIEGDTLNWSYNNVAKDSTCTIEPTDFGGYLSITLDSYILSNGIYSFNERDDWSATQLLADGQSTVGFGTFPYEDEDFRPYFTSPGHPASFVFGRNYGETPVYGGTYEYTLYPDKTLYVVRCEAYDSTGKFIVRFSMPYFVDGSSAGAVAPPLSAKPTSSTVFVNGTATAFDAYTIEGNNYFKLRDLAKVLSGSKKQFEVTWDSSKSAINLVSSKPYTVVGGELAKGDGATKSAQVNASAIYLDGQPITLTAYTMNGNNYFKLRDIGKLFDFTVSWDGKNNAIMVETNTQYTED